jgi:hypothetical protein
MNASALSIDSVFGNAIEIGTPEERVAYLDAACAGNQRDARLPERDGHTASQRPVL